MSPVPSPALRPRPGAPRLRRAALGLVAATAVAAGAAAEGLRRLPDLRFGRAAHAITALPDGRFLVTGGFSVQPRPVAVAEVFDPADGGFHATGAMLAPRFGHTASPLPDGTVLVAGGWDGAGAVLAAAERFDPATGRFRPLPPMGEARAGHVAVGLADGRVLLIGGVGPGREHRATAETFDPRTGRFSPAGRMTEPRENHAAVRLADGRVLVCGGHHGNRATRRVLASAEVFDPVSGRFSPAGPLLFRRHKHDAVRLGDGRVLVTGGAGGDDAPGDTTEFFDPARGTFSAGPRLGRARFKHAGTSVALDDGTALVLGGADRPERFLPAPDRFEPLPAALLAGAESYAATARSGQGGILLAGGYGDAIRGGSVAWLIVPDRLPRRGRPPLPDSAGPRPTSASPASPPVLP